MIESGLSKGHNYIVNTVALDRILIWPAGSMSLGHPADNLTPFSLKEIIMRDHM